MWIILIPWSRRWLRIGQVCPPLIANRNSTRCSPSTRQTMPPPSARAASGPGSARPKESPISRVPSMPSARRLVLRRGGLLAARLRVHALDRLLEPLDGVFDTLGASLRPHGGGLRARGRRLGTIG